MKSSKRNFTFFVILLVLLVAGCGGGGGGGGGGSTDDSVAGKLTGRMQSFSNASKSGNLASTMSNISRDYYDSGYNYSDMEALYRQLFAAGGRTWFGDLQGHEYVVDGHLAMRRFTATQYASIGGDTESTFLDAYEYFRNESGKWLIFGNQGRSREVDKSRAPSLGARVREQLAKLTAKPKKN